MHRRSLFRVLRSTSLLACVIVLSLSPTEAPRAEVVDIILLHNNTSSGYPAPPYDIGTPVEVRGVVTAGTGTYTSTYTDVWLQDATGGIEIYDPAVPTSFEIGDSVTISGVIDQYRGNTQINLGTWTPHSQDATVPEPFVLTCTDVENAFLPDYSEPNESRLIRLNGVTWTGVWPSYSGAVTLTDATGSCTMYIDGDTGVQDITPPGGTFDVIGILKQYDDFAPPFTDGYEILPRFPEDVIIPVGPQIIEGPEEFDIQPNSVAIAWTTDVPATSKVEYGETDSYEMGFVFDPTPVTDHYVVLEGLDPATIHHYRVTSESESGETMGGDRLFCTASDPSATGEVQVFFNQDVDTSVATYEPAQGDVALDQKLIERINAAQLSIDLCLYSFDLSNVATALIDANDRDVSIRFIYEDRDTYQGAVMDLINAGIPVIDDSFGDNSGSGLMHHKFIIFDARGGQPEDAWVWTGSYNVTPQGTNTDFQNVITVQDQALANVYTHEFNEMWGSETEVPNPDSSHFGTNKLDNTPKKFNIAGRDAKLYFSPSENFIAAMVGEVQASQFTTHFCVLSFTRVDLALALQDKHYNEPGYILRGVFDSGQSGDSNSQWHNMSGGGDFPWDPPADVWLDGETGILHHKYMLLDANRSGYNPTVITGSANWSSSALNSNDEHILILHDASVANQYYQEFARRYTAAGGMGDIAAGVEDPAEASVRLLSWDVGPNPFSGSVSLRLNLEAAATVEVDLLDVQGRRLARFVRRPQGPGPLRLDWTPGEGSGNGSGVYFMRIQAGRETHTLKLLRLQ